MANTIDTAFIKQFESEVHLAYQRMGSKLRNTVRQANNVTGNTVRFQKIGTGAATLALGDTFRRRSTLWLHAASRALLQGTVSQHPPKQCASVTARSLLLLQL